MLSLSHLNKKVVLSNINHLPLKHSLMVNPLGVQSMVAMVLVEVYQVKVEVVVTQ